MFQLNYPAQEEITQQVGNYEVVSNPPGLLTSGHTSLYISVFSTALLVVIYFTLPKK